MSSDTLAKLHAARPFHPFDIHLANGRAFRVAHPELLAYKPGNHMAVLVGANEVFEHIDLLLVTSIGVHASNGRRRKSA